MRKIYKYPLLITDEQTIEMPKYAKILSIQVQGVDPCIWALVNPEANYTTVTIRTIGTGHPIPDNTNGFEYIGTYQYGELVFHVFYMITQTMPAYTFAPAGS